MTHKAVQSTDEEPDTGVCEGQLKQQAHSESQLAPTANPAVQTAKPAPLARPHLSIPNWTDSVSQV